MGSAPTGTAAGAARHGYIRSAIAGSLRFAFQVYRLGSDIFQRFPSAMIRILASSAASLSCQVFALAALYMYLRALESNAVLLGLASRESLLLFLVMAAITLLLMIGFSVLEYRVNIAVLRLCRQYQNLGTAQALALSSYLPHWFTGEDDRYISTRHLRQILAVDVQHRSRMARVVLLAVIPAARLLLCAVALLYINPEFSLVILVAVGIPVVGLYSVGRRVADTITIRETGSPAVFLTQRKLLDQHWAHGTQITAAEIDWETTLGPGDSRSRQYFRRLREKAFGTFLINVANTVGIMVLVVALGFWILKAQQGNWSLWLTYLVALSYFLSSLRSTARSVVSATRFVRQTQRFTAFMNAALLAVNSDDPGAVCCPDHIAQAYKGASHAALGDDELDNDD